MKVCLLTRRPSLDSGGIGRVTLELKKSLVNRGDTVRLVAADKVDLASYFKYCFFDNWLKMPKGYDVYHAITPMEAIWTPKDKAIATILDIIPVVHPEMHGARMGGNWIKYSIGKECFTIGCKQAAKSRYIVCISDHVKQEFIEHFKVDEEKVRVIKLGIRKDLTPSLRKNKVFRIGYLGQLDRRKRVDILIKAFMESKLDAELVLGGSGMDELGLKELAQDDKRIKFLGFIPDENLVKFYNNLSVFFFPTSIEGYGLPPVEAMACKKPVIVLEDSIIPWEVKSRCIVARNLNGVLSSLRNLEEMCKTVSIEDNYKWAKSHDWANTIEEYTKLYKEVGG